MARAAGTLVLAHAAFARRVEWERPRGQGLAARLARRGYRTLAFDFRGHGDSPNGARGHGDSPSDGYDAFVRHDLPAVVACAKDRGGRVVVVGHSLGGHVALASQGLGLLGADAVLAVAANVWHPTFEPSLARQALKRGVATLMTGLTHGLGGFPRARSASAATTRAPRRSAPSCAPRAMARGAATTRATTTSPPSRAWTSRCARSSARAIASPASPRAAGAFLRGRAARAPRSSSVRRAVPPRPTTWRS